jgi:hypothetical protein
MNVERQTGAGESSSRCPDAPSRARQRFEHKYFVPPGKIPLAEALVRRTCRWDAEYPREQINSLYFDTADLEQHESSLSGEYAKDKVRVRWYGAEPWRPEAIPDRSISPHLVPVWVELKSRRGFASAKQRARMEVEAGLLAPDALRHGILPLSSLLSTVAGFGLLIARRIEPVIVISYWRCRFIEPFTGSRVSLDTRISSSMVKPGLVARGRQLELSGAVVEVKGTSPELPRCLLELARMGSSWTRFSKYSSSLDAHGATPGEVSRLWPAGTMHAEPATWLPGSRREVPACGPI